MPQTSSAQTLVESEPERRSDATPSQSGKKGALALGMAAFILGAAVMLMYSPLQQMERNDSAVYDYMAQCIVRGQIPYRDVIDSKGPGSPYISALIMSAGQAIGVQDILAVRLFYALLTGGLCAITFFVAELYLRSRIAGVIACSLQLVSEQSPK